MDKFVEILYFLSIFFVIFPLTGFIYVFIHESGHALFALMVGFKISSFTVGPLVWHLEGNVYKFKFSFKGLLHYFGRVQPIVTNVHNEKQYGRLRGKLALTLIGGNITELGGLLSLLYLAGLQTNRVIYLSMMMSIWTWFAISLLYGIDVLGILKLYRDKVSIDLCSYEWIAYGNYIDSKSFDFIKGKIVGKYDFLKQHMDEIKMADYLEYYNILLELYISGQIEKMPEERSEILDRFCRNPEAMGIKRYSTSLGVYLKALYKYLIYLYLSGEDKEELKNMYKKIQNTLPPEALRTMQYERKRVEQILGITDNRKYLSNPRHLSSYFMYDKGFSRINRQIDINLLRCS